MNKKTLPRGATLEEVKTMASTGLVDTTHAVPLEDDGWGVVVGMIDGKKATIYNVRGEVKTFKSLNALVTEIENIFEGRAEVSAINFEIDRSPAI